MYKLLSRLFVVFAIFITYVVHGAEEARPVGLRRTSVPTTILPAEPLTKEELKAFRETVLAYPISPFYTDSRKDDFSSILSFLRLGSNPRIAGPICTDLLPNIVHFAIYLSGATNKAAAKKTLSQHLSTVSKMTAFLVNYWVTIEKKEGCNENWGIISLTKAIPNNLYDRLVYIRTDFGYLPLLIAAYYKDLCTTPYSIMETNTLILGDEDEGEKIIIPFNKDGRSIEMPSGVYYSASSLSSRFHVASKKYSGLSGKVTIKAIHGPTSLRPFESAGQESYALEDISTEAATSKGDVTRMEYAEDDIDVTRYSLFQKLAIFFNQHLIPKLPPSGSGGVHLGTIASLFLPIPESPNDFQEIMGLIACNLESGTDEEQEEARQIIAAIQGAPLLSLEDAKQLLGAH